ncbi:MAG: hypothetical protein OEW37_00205 [Rhodospirillaceae bacterium]|nr:hypothetical protein [Rhodospirillaceae bacterium]
MSDALERAKTHFRNLLNEASLIKIVVDEWDGLEIFFKPLDALKAKELDRVLAGESKANVEGMVEVLITRALDSDGRPLFKPVEKNEILRHVSPQVVIKTLSRMAEAADEMLSVDDVGKS